MTESASDDLTRDCPQCAAAVKIFTRNLLSGVELAVDRQQTVFVDMGVYFRGGDIAVAEHLLNCAEVSTVFEQMGGKTVPQGVRVDLFIYPGKECGFFDYRPKAFAVEPFSGAGDE